ncbi:MAG TPA: hypothetical protein VN643_00370 [Pyrinomonadaceae bacterium]|nr:hypothetical protein [Pyrinomonadaceae bacterium]
MASPNKLCKIILTISIPLLLLSCAKRDERVAAESIAARIHSQLQQNDFAAVYRESGSSFKQVGDREKFIARMQQFIESNGALLLATQVSYQTGFDSKAGNNHTLTFALKFERGNATEKIVLTPNDQGQLSLWDLKITPVP